MPPERLNQYLPPKHLQTQTFKCAGCANGVQYSKFGATLLLSPWQVSRHPSASRLQILRDEAFGFISTVMKLSLLRVVACKQLSCHVSLPFWLEVHKADNAVGER